jgi:hypothetical protein
MWGCGDVRMEDVNVRMRMERNVRPKDSSVGGLHFLTFLDSRFLDS